jgi:hypothetical protein
LENSVLIGQAVTVKKGASSWMKSRGYWLPDMGESIDGMRGQVVSDYTHLRGADAHYGIALDEARPEVGVHPDLLDEA